MPEPSPEILAARRRDPRYAARPWRKGGRIAAIRASGTINEQKLADHFSKADHPALAPTCR